MTVTSFDGGKTWTKEKELCVYKGRVYDACYHDGVIYVLEFCNDGTGHFCGEKEEHVYRIFASTDYGETFEEKCVVPIPAMGRGYGSMLFDDVGRLHVFAYNINDEQNMDHIISCDGANTWEDAEVCYLKDGIRNPQVAQIDGIFVGIIIVFCSGNRLKANKVNIALIAFCHHIGPIGFQIRGGRCACGDLLNVGRCAAAINNACIDLILIFIPFKF